MNGTDRDGYTSLMQAARNGHNNFLNVAPLSHIDINAQSHEDGTTVLILAAEGRRSKFVEFALKQGAKVNLVDDEGCIALQYAGRYGDHVIVKQLLDAGADVNKAEGYRGRTALMEAACEDNPECVNVLLTAGANVNIVDDDQYTALMHAAEEGNPECLKLLLGAGADVNMTDEDNWTAFEHAARFSQQGCIKIFLQFESDDKKRQESINKALILSANDSNCVKYLIKAGADVNTANSHGITALITAARWGNFESIRMLLNSGAHVNKLSSGFNALKVYTESSRPVREDVVMLLHAAGEEVEGTTSAELSKFLPHQQPQLNLKQLCRQAIRKHLLQMNPHQHLFGRIPQLGLPSIIANYLLFDV